MHALVAPLLLVAALAAGPVENTGSSTPAIAPTVAAQTITDETVSIEIVGAEAAGLASDPFVGMEEFASAGAKCDIFCPAQGCSLPGQPCGFGCFCTICNGVLGCRP